MKNSRKFLSIILALLMLTSVCIVGASAADDPLVYQINDDGVTCHVDSCDKNAEGVITIPESYDGRLVTSIKRVGLSCCPKITGVIIPKTVTYIEMMKVSDGHLTVFIESNAIESFSVDEENPAYCSVDGVLYTKDMKTLVCYPPAKAGDTFVVPDGVEKIENYAFRYSKLKKITLPNSVKTLGEGAFCFNAYLEEINLPDGLTEIPVACFMYTASLKNVNIPDAVTEIGDQAFMMALSLEEIRLPADIKSIGFYAFAGCIYLEKINIPEGAEGINGLTFVQTPFINDIEYTLDSIDVFTEAFTSFGVQRSADYDEAKVKSLLKEGVSIFDADNSGSNEKLTEATLLLGYDLTGTVAPVIDYTKTTVRINYNADLKAAFENAYPGINVVCIDHTNTEVRNAAEATYDAPGYTGDTYCTDCGTLIEQGKEITQLEKPEEPDVPETPEEDNTTETNSIFHWIIELIKVVIEFLTSVF